MEPRAGNPGDGQQQFGKEAWGEHPSGEKSRVFHCSAAGGQHKAGSLTVHGKLEGRL